MTQTIRRILRMTMVALLAATSLRLTAGPGRGRAPGASAHRAAIRSGQGFRRRADGRPAGGGRVDAGAGATITDRVHLGLELEAGGLYPEAWLRYAATFECGDLVIPDQAGVIQGSLHRNPGGLLLHQGPDVSFLFCRGVSLPPASSGGEITLTGPGSFYINSNSIVDLLPADGVTWIWTYLPAGCVGVGSPRAVCDMDTEPFNIT